MKSRKVLAELLDGPLPDDERLNEAELHRLALSCGVDPTAAAALFGALRELPEGWSRGKGSDGSFLYVNVATKVAQSDHPNLPDMRSLALRRLLERTEARRPQANFRRQLFSKLRPARVSTPQIPIRPRRAIQASNPSLDR